MTTCQKSHVRLTMTSAPACPPYLILPTSSSLPHPPYLILPTSSSLPHPTYLILIHFQQSSPTPSAVSAVAPSTLDSYQPTSIGGVGSSMQCTLSPGRTAPDALLETLPFTLTRPARMESCMQQQQQQAQHCLPSSSSTRHHPRIHFDRAGPDGDPHACRSEHNSGRPKPTSPLPASALVAKKKDFTCF